MYKQKYTPKEKYYLETVIVPLSAFILTVFLFFQLNDDENTSGEMILAYILAACVFLFNAFDERKKLRGKKKNIPFYLNFYLSILLGIVTAALTIEYLLL